MAKIEMERLRATVRAVAGVHPAAGAARAVEQQTGQLLNDQAFLSRVQASVALRRNLDIVRDDIETSQGGDPEQLRDYLEAVRHWSATLAGDPTTPPPRRRPRPTSGG